MKTEVVENLKKILEHISPKSELYKSQKAAIEFLENFVSWQETHYEVCEVIALQMDCRTPKKKLLEHYEGTGRGGLYELSKDITDKFEEKNKNRSWDGEFMEEVISFTYSYIDNL